jgi:hypothetical protein
LRPCLEFGFYETAVAEVSPQRKDGRLAGHARGGSLRARRRILVRRGPWPYKWAVSNECGRVGFGIRSHRPILRACTLERLMCSSSSQNPTAQGSVGIWHTGCSGAASIDRWWENVDALPPAREYGRNGRVFVLLTLPRRRVCDSTRGLSLVVYAEVVSPRLQRLPYSLWAAVKLRRPASNRLL